MKTRKNICHWGPKNDLNLKGKQDYFSDPICILVLSIISPYCTGKQDTNTKQEKHFIAVFQTDVDVNEEHSL